MKKITVHELIHALEQIEEAYGEGELIESISIEEGDGDYTARVTVQTNGAMFPIDIDDDWE